MAKKTQAGVAIRPESIDGKDEVHPVRDVKAAAKAAFAEKLK